jgi:hypothetical protein
MLAALFRFASPRASGRQFEVLQVKEKFDGLRVQVNHANDDIRQLILAAELESLHTCEVCGNRDDCGRMVGSRICARSMRADKEQ